MKKRKDEEKVKVTWRIPTNLKQKLDESAIRERRSENDQLIVLLENILTALENSNETE